MEELGIFGRWVRRLRVQDLPIYLAIALICMSTVQGFAWLAVASNEDLTQVDRLIRLATIIANIGVGLFIATNFRADQRSIYLACLLALVGSAFAVTGLHVFGETPLRFLETPLDAFFPFALWSFFLRWPGGRISFIAKCWLGMLFVVASFLVICNLLSIYEVSSASPINWFDQHGNHNNRANLFDALVYGLALLALPVWLMRLRHAGADDRRRARFFTLVMSISLTLSCSYIIVVTTASAMGWALMETPLFQHIGVTFDMMNLLVPLAVCYSLVVDEMLPMRVTIRQPLRFLVGRYVIVGVGLAPFLILATNLYMERYHTLVSLADSATVVWMLLLAIPGGLSIRANRVISTLLEQQFFRHGYNLDDAVSRAMNIAMECGNPEELGSEYVDLFHDLLQPSRAAFYRLDPATGEFHTTNIIGATAVTDKLVQELAQVDHHLITADPDLPPACADWMASQSFDLLLPLHIEDGRLAAFLALGPKRSQLAYSFEDRRLCEAVAKSARLVLSATRMRRYFETDNQAAFDVSGAFRVCEGCTRILPATRYSCCGQPTFGGGLPRLINDRFRIERLLGKGGTGIVYAAIDQALYRRVAVKCLTHANTRQAHYFRRESIAAAGLNNPHLAAIYDAQVCNGMPVLIYELMEKGNLEEVLMRRKLELDEIMELARSVAEGVGYLHENGILHRDIKPANIGFDRDGNAKLLDFGLINTSTAGSVPPTDLVQTETMHASLARSGCMGTPLYWAPEILAGEKPGKAADVWALCCVLFETITGQHPFERDSWPETASAILKGCIAEIPQGMEALLGPVMDGLRLDAEARPAASTLATAFAHGK